MSKIRKIAALFILLEIICLLIGNIYVGKVYSAMNTRAYKVEISRIKTELEEGKEIKDIDYKKYKRVVSVSEFEPNEQTKNEYAVELIDGKLYRFEYNKADMSKVLIVMNVTYIMIIALTIIVFLYLERKIINPFNRMNSITTELSKGNLTVPIKQEKSKYFKDFLWGLDMLRDKLEGDRQRELELLKEKKLMVLSLSHDIKTPLSASDLYIKALLKDLYKTDEERDNALKGIEKNLAEIKGYVNEIAEASREDFISIEVKNGEFYLQPLLDELRGYYKEKCKRLHIDFTIEETDNCILFGDYDRMIEVVQNIIENAIKYGDGKRISITMAEEEGCKLISITNSGNPPKEDEIPHLFDSFYRGSNTGHVDGNGLGLYICKALMHKMDGDIFAQIGTDEFTITLVVRKL